MADELDDQLDYSFDIGSDDGRLKEVDELLSEDETTKSRPKRAHDSDNEPETKAEPPKKKSKKNKSKLAEKKQARMMQSVEQKLNIGRMEPSIIADFIIGKVRDKKENKDLSTVELEERSVPEKQIVDTSSFDKRTLEDMPKFFAKYKLDQIKAPGLVLVLSMSAIRACDVARELRNTTKHGAMKLINKNHVHYDKKALDSAATIACATPGRVVKLIKENILAADRIRAVVVDSSFVDVKTLSVWDIEDTIPLVSTLSEDAKIYVY